MRLRFLGTSTDVGFSRNVLGWLGKMASTLALMRLIGRRIFSGDPSKHTHTHTTPICVMLICYVGLFLFVFLCSLVSCLVDYGMK